VLASLELGHEVRDCLFVDVAEITLLVEAPVAVSELSVEIFIAAPAFDVSDGVVVGGVEFVVGEPEPAHALVFVVIVIKDVVLVIVVVDVPVLVDEVGVVVVPVIGGVVVGVNEGVEVVIGIIHVVFSVGPSGFVVEVQGSDIFQDFVSGVVVVGVLGLHSVVVWVVDEAVVSGCAQPPPKINVIVGVVKLFAVFPIDNAATEQIVGCTNLVASIPR